jgi:diacylglycerol kinase family enzyme
VSTLLIVNPAATTAHAWVRDAIVDSLARVGELEVCTTNHRGHATELAAEARRHGVTHVATLGGDGTVNEAVNGLLQAGPGPDVPILLPIPGGHTNVLTRLLGIPQDPLEAMGAIAEGVRAGRVRRISLGLADDRYFLFSAGLGLDAEVLRRVEHQRAQGAKASIPRYVASTLLTHAMNAPVGKPRITIELPHGGTISGVYTAIVQNGAVWTYAGSLPITFAPDTHFDNGLSVFGIRALDPLSLGNYLARAALRPDRLDGDSTASDLDSLRLHAGEPTLFQVDGDVIGDRREVHLRSMPGALRVGVVG